MNNLKLITNKNIYKGIKCFKYKIETYYILQNRFEGENIDSTINNILQKLSEPLKVLEKIEIYLPVEKDKFEDMITWIKNTSISNEKKPSTKTLVQYFVNYQIVQQLKNKLDENNWIIQLEPYYNVDDCKNRADVKISHKVENFSIWIESDDKRTDQIYKKLWEKVAIIGKNKQFNNDVFCTFIYTTEPCKKAVHNCFIRTRDTIINNIGGNNLRGSYALMGIVENDNKEVYLNNMVLDDNNIIVIPIIKIRPKGGKNIRIYRLSK